MTDIIAEPFDWNDNLSEEAIESFESIRENLPYCTCQSIGMALAKLELLEKQGCKCSSGHGRKFEGIVVEYPPANLCIYPEYKGRPYFSIRYEENGEHIIGFGTYNPQVLTRYLQEYFISDIQPNTGRWIRVDKDKLRCSECEVIHLIAQYPNGKVDWCPNCGARMLEPQEGGDQE